MTSQEKMNLEKTFIKINQENDIKEKIMPNINILIRYLPKMIQMTSESSQDPILNINVKFSETFNVSPTEKLFNDICNNFLKYTSLNF